MLAVRAAVFATALFAVGVPFIGHGSEVKQYSADVAVALALTLTALGLPGGPGRPWPYWRAGLIGLGAVWFSQPAVFVLAGLGAAVAAARILRRDRAALAALLPTLAVWAAAAAASAAWSRRLLTASTGAFMLRFWAAAFPDLSPLHRFGLGFLATRLRDFWGEAGMLYPLPGLFVALMALGVAAAWLRRREDALLILGPPAAAFAAAAARLYPFEGRFLLFAGPSFLIAAASGADAVGRALARLRVPRPLTAAALALPAAFALAGHPPVLRHEEARPIFAELARRRRPGDAIYLYYAAGPALRYYGPRFGIPPSAATVGGCHGSDLVASLRELDEFRGRPRVWILVLRAPRSLAQQQTMRAYAAAIGHRLEVEIVPEDEGRESTLELFDFTDPGRLAAAAAETFPLPPVNPRVAERLGCGNGPR